MIPDRTDIPRRRPPSIFHMDPECRMGKLRGKRAHAWDVLLAAREL